MSRTKILIIGNHRQTITSIRSLAKAGYHVVVGRENKRVFTQYSRHTAEVWSHPDIESSEQAFAGALEKYLNDRRDIAFVFPMGESGNSCLLRHPEAIPPSVSLVMANASAIRTCLDKYASYKMVASLGLPHVPFRKALDYAALLAAADEIGYPCVVKPNTSRTTLLGKKALIISSIEDLVRSVPAWPEDTDFMVLQRWMPGDRHNCNFVAERGRLLSYFEQRVLRTDRRDGTGYMVDGVSAPPRAALKQYCESLAAALDYSGAGCAQFLVDERNGSASFLELNPRLDAACALPYYCGYDFPRMAVELAEYHRGTMATPPVNVAAYPVGKHCVWLGGDVQSWLREVRTNETTLQESMEHLVQMAMTFFSGDFHMVWLWSDPLPACYLFTGLVLSFLWRLTGGIRRRSRPAS